VQETALPDRVLPEGGRFLKPETAAKIKFDRGRSWIWDRVKNDPTFPKPYYIDHKSPLFLEAELDGWIAARVATCRRETREVQR
jgi:predicted DNA-binding transcriptional regulator AlpA